MRRSFVLLVFFTLAAALGPRAAQAQTARAVVVSYETDAPACASREAFQALLETELARVANPARPWRFAVAIHAAPDGYRGTLTTEEGVRTVTAAHCDDVAGELARLVATARPAPDDSGVTLEMPARPSKEAPPPAASSRGAVEWRAGARFFASNHGTDDSSPTLGGTVFGSVELPWGFRRTLFEVGVGTFGTAIGAAAPVSVGARSIQYYLIDTQVCPIDLALGQSGVSVLGCFRLAGAMFTVDHTETGGAFWSGAGARIRWQTPIRLFMELELDGVVGTVSSGESNHPAWVALGLGAGLRL